MSEKMSENSRKDLILLGYGEEHKSVGEEYIITEDHTIADVVHWLVQQAGGTEEIQYLLDEIDNRGEID